MQKRHYTTKGVKKMYHCGKNSFLAQMEKVSEQHQKQQNSNNHNNRNNHAD